MQQVLAQWQSQDHLEALVLLAHLDLQDSQDPLGLLEFLVILVLKVIREIKENRVLLLTLVRQREQKDSMVLDKFLDHLVLLVPQGLLDVQVILDQVFQDHLVNQAHQDMADLVLKETREIQETLCLIQEHFLRDHLGHQDLQGPRDQQVPKVQEDTKGNQVNLAFQGAPVELSLIMV